MPNLFELPTDLLRANVLPFLSLRDLVNVDTAALSRHPRRKFRECLDNFYASTECTPISDSSARWLHERLVRPASIRICWSVTDEVVPVLAEVASRASSVEWDSGVDSQLCPQLLEHFSSRTTNHLVHTLHMCEHSDGFNYESMPNLTHLHLPQFTDELTRGSWSRALQELSINHWEQAINDSQLRSMVEHCPALRSLSIVGAYSFTQKTAEAIGQHCPHLESLSLVSDGFPDVWLEPIARGCLRLHTLDFGGSSHLNELDINRGLQCLPALTKLSLVTCPLSGHALLPVLSAHCLLLRSLELSVETLSHEGVDDDLRLMPALQELSVTPSQTGPCLPLSTFRAICVAKPDLQKLCLSLDATVSVITTTAPASALPLTQLRVLNLSTDDLLGEDALCELVSANPRLVELGLYGPSARGIGDPLMLTVAEHCSRNLTVLHLPAGKKVTDAGIIAVAQRCVHLTRLYISGSDGITDASVLALTRYTPALTFLSLTCAKGVSKSAVLALTAGCRKLTNLYVHSSVITKEEAEELRARNPITWRCIFAMDL